MVLIHVIRKTERIFPNFSNAFGTEKRREVSMETWTQILLCSDI